MIFGYYTITTYLSGLAMPRDLHAQYHSSNN